MSGPVVKRGNGPTKGCPSCRERRLGAIGIDNEQRSRVRTGGRILAGERDMSQFKQPNDLVFPTQNGKPDNRNNVRRRLLVKAIEGANVKLVKLGIEPIGAVSPHGLRRTYASLRCAVGDDVAYTAAQLGHEDAVFSSRRTPMR